MNKLITITRKDIERAEQYRNNQQIKEYCSNCPVANALKRALKNKVSVCYTYASVYKQNKETVYPLPENVREFIQNFDKRNTVKPFSFRLN